MAYNRHKNACQKSQRIHQNIQCFSDNLLPRTVKINRVDYLYNLSDNIIEINGTSYNIQWEGEHPIIVDNNGSRMNTPPPIAESVELAITSYLAYLAREGGVEQIHFLLVQHVAESCPISKSLGVESCLKELKSLKDRNVYEVVDLSKGRKVIKNYWVFNIKSDSHYRP